MRMEAMLCHAMAESVVPWCAMGRGWEAAQQQQQQQQHGVSGRVAGAARRAVSIPRRGDLPCPGVAKAPVTKPNTKEGELRNKKTRTPAAHAAPLASACQCTQKTKRKTRPAIRRSARWRANY